MSHHHLLLLSTMTCFLAACVHGKPEVRSQMIRVETDPPGARIWQRTETGRWLVGKSPTTVWLEYNVTGSGEKIKRTHFITAEKDGYVAKTAVTAPSKQKRLLLELLPQAEPIEKEQRSGGASTGTAKSVERNVSYGDIWFVAVGISKTAEANLRFEHAAQQAAALYEFYTSDTGGMLPEDRARLLQDESATRAGLIKQLSQFVKRIPEQDVLVLYLSTALLTDRESGDLYFFMYDTKPDNLIGTALAKHHLESVIKRFSGGMLVVFMDLAVPAGTALGKSGQSVDIDLTEINRSIGSLADLSDRVIFLSACTRCKTDSAGDSANAGKLTRLVISGLRGAADSNADQSISLKELYAFIQSETSTETSEENRPLLSGRPVEGLVLIEFNP
jgi:hypothetical protein